MKILINLTKNEKIFKFYFIIIFISLKQKDTPTLSAPEEIHSSETIGNPPKILDDILRESGVPNGCVEGVSRQVRRELVKAFGDSDGVELSNENVLDLASNPDFQKAVENIVNEIDGIGSVGILVRFHLARIGVACEYIEKDPSWLDNFLDKIDPNHGAQLLGAGIGVLTSVFTLLISEITGKNLESFSLPAVDGLIIGALVSTFLNAYQSFDARKEKKIRTLMASFGTAMTTALSIIGGYTYPSSIPLIVLSDAVFFAFWEFSGMSRDKRIEDFHTETPFDRVMSLLRVCLREHSLADRLMQLQVKAGFMNREDFQGELNSLFDELMHVLRINNNMCVNKDVVLVYFDLLEGNKDEGSNKDGNIKNQQRGRRAKGLLFRRS